jgi:hypothetical protein
MEIDLRGMVILKATCEPSPLSNMFSIWQHISILSFESWTIAKFEFWCSSHQAINPRPWEPRAKPRLTRGSLHSTWKKRTDPWKMSGTPSQNTWKTMGSENLWEPRAETGTGGSPNQSHGEPRTGKVKIKVEEMHIEPSLPRMPSEEHKNLRKCYAGPLPSGLWLGDTLGSRDLSSLDEENPLDGRPIYRAKHWRRGSRSPSLCPKNVPDLAAQLTDWLLESMGDRCRHEAVNSPLGAFIEGEATLYPTSALTTPTFSIERLSLAGRGPTRWPMDWSSCRRVQQDK